MTREPTKLQKKPSQAQEDRTKEASHTDTAYMGSVWLVSLHALPSSEVCCVFRCFSVISRLGRWDALCNRSTPFGIWPLARSTFKVLLFPHKGKTLHLPGSRVSSSSACEDSAVVGTSAGSLQLPFRALHPPEVPAKDKYGYPLSKALKNAYGKAGPWPSETPCKTPCGSEEMPSCYADRGRTEAASKLNPAFPSGVRCVIESWWTGSQSSQLSLLHRMSRKQGSAGPVLRDAPCLEEVLGVS